MEQRDIFGEAKWVGVGNDCTVPYLRDDFYIDHLIKAEIVICGLGFFELYLNGKRVGDHCFEPVTSDYTKRNILVNGQPFDEEMNHRTYCVRYDISGCLKNGGNKLAVMLGPGWFGTKIEMYDDAVNYGPVRLIYRIILKDDDGSRTEVLSGESVRWTESPVISSSLFGREKHDYAAFACDGWQLADKTNWKPVEILNGLQCDYQIQDCPADRAVRRIQPVLIKQFGECRVYDVGENITGWVILRTFGREGAKITVHFSEELNSCGALNQYFRYGQEWEIRSDGAAREIHPHFTWFGFRYFSVTGDAEAEAVEVIHSDIKVTSGFSCESETLNWVYDAYIRTQMCNMHAGIPSDCPHIERRGYTGDGQLACRSSMLLLDSHDFYRKWMRDIMDCQDVHTGHVQYTAPYTRCGGGPGGWGSAIISVPLTYYRQYGDIEPLREMYPGMLRYLGYLEAHSEHDLVTSDRENEWCLGDWCTPGEIKIPEPFVNTCFHVKSLQQIREIEEILGLPYSDPHRKKELRIRDAICRYYFDEATGNFAGGVQGANGFAIDIGLGDGRTLENLVKYYDEKKAYDTGIFGTEIVTRILFEKGYPGTALALLDSKDPVSFEGWRKAGATTLWEYWPGEKERSHSHPMFGAVTYLLFEYILGIRQNGAGWKNVIIAPVQIEGFPSAKGYITTPQGQICVSYFVKDEKKVFLIDIPESTEAEFVWSGERKKLFPGRNTLEIDIHAGNA